MVRRRGLFFLFVICRPHKTLNYEHRVGLSRRDALTCAFVFQQHFFDDDDRMVPSTPTLVVPHRTDGFAEAIQ